MITTTNDNTIMNKQQVRTFKKFASSFVKSVGLAGLMALSNQTMAQTAFQSEDAFWYGQVQGSYLSTPDSTFQSSLGSSISLAGMQTLASGQATSIALGRQFSWRNGSDDNMPVRVEIEAWSGHFDRTAVSLGIASAKLHDQVKANVVFLNGAVRVSRSDEKYDDTDSPVGQLWLKLGLGQGSVKYPDASGSLGCSCMRAADSNGTSWQLQLAYERHLGKSLVVYGQIGHVWLPSVTGTQTTYARLDTDAVTVGLRFMLR